MPKLNVLHLLERLKERLGQLENGEEIDARDVKALLNVSQQVALENALLEQKELRKQYRQPKTEERKKEIGWKTIREVRIGVCKQAIKELESGLVENVKQLQKQREAKAARIFMDAYCKAKNEGRNAWSAGQIALARNGFRKNGGVGLTKRDKEIREMEESLKNQLEKQVGGVKMEIKDSKKTEKKG